MDFELEQKLAEAEKQLAEGVKPIPLEEAMEGWRKLLQQERKC